MKKLFLIILLIIFFSSPFKLKAEKVEPKHFLIFPNVKGISGFIFNPSAYILDYGMISLGLHPFIFKAGYGLINSLEGNILIDFGKSNDILEILKYSKFNLKWQIIKEENNFVSISTGLTEVPFDIFDEEKRQNLYFYLIFSKELYDFDFTLGVKKFLGNENTDFLVLTPIFDISKVINDTILFIVEFDGQNYNTGIKISLNYNINVEIFIKNVQNINKSKELGNFLKEYFIFGITYIE